MFNFWLFLLLLNRMNFLNVENGIIIVNLVLFLLTPFLPNFVYNNFVDTYVGTVILMLLALYEASFGYLQLLSGFAGIAGLYAESHARKVKKIKQDGNIEKSGEYVKQLEPAPPVQANEVHPEIPEADHEMQTFMPKEDDGSNAFKPVDSTINTKVPLETTSFSKNAEEVYTSNNLAEKLD